MKKANRLNACIALFDTSQWSFELKIQILVLVRQVATISLLLILKKKSKKNKQTKKQNKKTKQKKTPASYKVLYFSAH